MRKGPDYQAASARRLGFLFTAAQRALLPGDFGAQEFFRRPAMGLRLAGKVKELAGEGGLFECCGGGTIALPDDRR